MFNALFKIVFSVIMKLAQILISPIIALIGTIFSPIGQMVVFASQYLSLAVSYIPTVLKLLMIPPGAVVLLFDFIIAYYSFYIGGRVYLFALNMYNKFKI